MAEQRHYRISGSAAQPQLGRVKRLALLSLAGAFIAINWVTTQHAWRVLSYASWLGQPLFRLPWTGSVYWPLSWVAWWIRWHDVPALTPLWISCAREALYPMAAITAICSGAIAWRAMDGSQTLPTCTVPRAGQRRVT